MPITEQQLLEVIARAPLVSIDLVVRDAEDRVLLGLRKNEPAMGMWFVPGGRIHKDEDLDEAFERISSGELGVGYHRSAARFIGVFDHKYETNFLGVKGIGTHYVVLAYELHPSILLDNLPTAQHRKFRWFSKDEANRNFNVHRYVLPYFNSAHFDEAFECQYAALNARRDSFNSLLWQTPVLSLTAQAFLFIIALSQNVSDAARKIAASLALIVAIASIQLLTKHRFNEVDHADLLQKLENEQGLLPINERRVPNLTWNPETWVAWLPSYWVWIAIMLGFGICALLILIYPCWFKI